MRIENGKLVCEPKPCSTCDGTGQSYAIHRCRECLGTGAGKRGKARGCKGCYGHGATYGPDRDPAKPCECCKGTGRGLETLTDQLPETLWQSLTFKVIREASGAFGLNESCLGLGYVFTCGDYGSAWRGTDEAVLRDVRGHQGYNQACKVCRDDGTLCSHIAILITPHGYKVKAIY